MPSSLLSKHSTTIFGYLFILFFSIFAMKSLATPGLFTSHDSGAHITRLIEFHQALNDGQFPPRWGAGFFQGLGSPVMMLNYQLPYFIADGFFRLGFSYFDAFKLTLALSYVLANVFAYHAFSKIFGWKAGVLGAMLYAWAPYRFVDIYVRASLGESFAFTFFPIILYGIHKRSTPIMVIGFTGLFLSHPVTSALFSVIFFGYAICHFLIEHVQWKELRRYLAAFVLAFMLASFNLVPTLLLTKDTRYTPASSEPLRHFPTLRQLVSSTWGYGFSTADNDEDDMSFRIGYSQLILFVLTPIVLITVYQTKKKRATLAVPAYMLTVYIASFYLLQRISIPVWKFISLDHMIDFPWRLLMVPISIAAYLGAWVVSRLKHLSAWLVVIILLTITVRANINSIHINALWPWGIEHYLEDRGTGDAYGEYASNWRHTKEGTRFDQRMEFIQGKGTIAFEENISHRMRVTLHTESSAVLRVNLMYFPGWKVWLDGKEMELGAGKRCAVTTDIAQQGEDDLSGLIVCAIPKGDHVLRAEFTAPSAQVLGNLISLAGLIIVLWNMYRSFSQRTTNRRVLSRLFKLSKKNLRKQNARTKSS